MQKRKMSSIIRLSMRKFVVKNRQKRKYVRKSEKQSLYSFSKTTYGMLPVLITAIAFMATLVISSPLRNSLTSFRFSLPFPQLSFSNPFLFFQTFGGDVLQVYTAFITLVTAILTSINTFTAISINNVTHIRPAINYQPPVISFNFAWLFAFENMISTTFLYLFQNLLKGLVTVDHLVLSFYKVIHLINTSFNMVIASLAITTATSLDTFIITSADVISEITLVVWQFIAQISILIFHETIVIAGVISHIVLEIGHAILTSIIFIINAIVRFIIQTTDEIISVIEIPFKILANFFLILKPYFIILGNHIQMAGGDLNNGFVSIGKVSTELSPPK